VHSYTQNNVLVSMHSRECLHACITVACKPCTVLTNEKARTCVLSLNEEARRVTVTVPHLATEGKATFSCKYIKRNLVSFRAVRREYSPLPATVFYNHYLSSSLEALGQVFLGRFLIFSISKIPIVTKRSEIEFEHEPFTSSRF
jgi:hypothetical protein